MDVGVAFQIALSVLAALGGGGLIVFALAGALGKIWSNRLMQGDIARHNQDLASLKSKLAQMESEHQIRFSKLHAEQAAAVAELYERLFHFNMALSRLNMELYSREIREASERQLNAVCRDDWETVEGIHALRAEESARIDELSRITSDLSIFYGTKRLFTPAKLLSAYGQAHYTWRLYCK